MCHADPIGEHTFDIETVRRWREAADRAHSEWHIWTSVNQRATLEANAAVLDLKMLLAQSVSKPVAEWAVANWLITGQPIDVRVREELAEQRPWPESRGAAQKGNWRRRRTSIREKGPARCASRKQHQAGR